MPPLTEAFVFYMGKKLRKFELPEAGNGAIDIDTPTIRVPEASVIVGDCAEAGEITPLSPAKILINTGLENCAEVCWLLGRPVAEREPFPPSP